MVCTHGRVCPSGLMSAFVMGREALGPIGVPHALVEKESARKTKESRLSMINDSLRRTEQSDAQP
jgi:hypothetical protein